MAGGTARVAKVLAYASFVLPFFDLKEVANDCIVTFRYISTIDHDDNVAY